MSTKTTSGLSTFTPSAKSRTKKTPLTKLKRNASIEVLSTEIVVSRSLSSPLTEIYKRKEFQTAWDNSAAFHVARNIIHLRRRRKMSQAELAAAIQTSQPAIARIECGEGNVTLGTLERIANALSGRIQISIAPQELKSIRSRPWWEVDTPSLSTFSEPLEGQTKNFWSESVDLLPWGLSDPKITVSRMPIDHSRIVAEQYSGWHIHG